MNKKITPKNEEKKFSHKVEFCVISNALCAEHNTNLDSINKEKEMNDMFLLY